MFILLNNCPFDDAKVRQFWEVGKSFADFCPKLWRQGQESATYRRRDGRIVSQTVCCFSRWYLGMTAAMTQYLSPDPLSSALGRDDKVEE